MRFGSSVTVHLCHKLVVYTRFCRFHSLYYFQFACISVRLYIMYLSFSVLKASSRQGELILLFHHSIYLGSFVFMFSLHDFARLCRIAFALVCYRIQCSLLVSCFLF